MIELDQVHKSYDNGQTFAVNNVSLNVAQGEFLVLLGESGCGKTTLLKSINRLNDITSGTLRVDGRNVAEVNPVTLRREIGYVFQEVGLFPHMTIAENISIVPRLLGWKSEEIPPRVDELLDMVKLSPDQYRHRLPRELSGGQRQRIGLARALAARPKIMLMDEPFGALDPLNRDALQDEYRQLHESLGLTTVMVTHDMTEALLMADRIAVMLKGRLLQAGTPQTLLREPAEEYVERLIATPKRQADQLEALAGKAES